MIWEAVAERMSTEVAIAGRRLLSEEHGYAYLATVAGDGSARVHPVAPVVTAEGLYLAVAERSPKLRDLRRDGRVALHSSVVPPADEEFAVRGVALEIADAAAREQISEARLSGAELRPGMVLFSVTRARSAGPSGAMVCRPGAAGQPVGTDSQRRSSCSNDRLVERRP